jgi:DNA-binding response OmpR family regulator
MTDSLVTSGPDQQAEPAHILLVEDDPALVHLVRQLLATSGHDVWATASGAEARALLTHRQPDLILLDLMLPDTDGLVLTPLFKSLSAAPIIILSARAGQVDRVLGLRLGADDFVAKPFDPEELLVRIAAVLRRGGPHAPPPARHADHIHVGQLTIARGGGLVTIGGEPLHLTPTEYRLLVILADHADQVMSRAMLLQLVWGYQDPSAGHVVDVHLARLRRKLARCTGPAPSIVTAHGLGYKLVPRPLPPASRRSARVGATAGAAARSGRTSLAEPACVAALPDPAAARVAHAVEQGVP